MPLKESGIGTLSGVCVVVNLLMGSGYLALPHGFFVGGLVGSTVVLLAVLGVMIVTCLWESKCVVKAGRVLNSSKIPEVAEAMRVFCGKFWRNVYISVLSLSIGTSSWVFAILFAQTISASLPLYRPEVLCQVPEEDGSGTCQTRYVLNILLLGLFTTPLALMDVSEQAIVQNILAILRFLRCALMIVTPLLATTTEQLDRSFPYANASQAAQMPLMLGSTDGMCVVLSVCVFSFFLNSSVPIFIDALSNVNHALRILIYGFIVTASLYWMLGAVNSYTFGSSITSTCNLAWHGYRWPFAEHCTAGSLCDISAKVVEYVVVLSPILDVVSVYPLGTIVLANSVWEVVFGVAHHDFPGAVDQPLVDHYLPVSAVQAESEKAINETTRLINGGASSLSDPAGSSCSHLFAKKAVRFVLNTLPLTLAVLIKDFLQIVSLAGSISVLICLVFPAYLSLRCSSYDEENIEECVTPDNHLDWCDKPFHEVFPGLEKPEDGGGHVIRRNRDPDSSIIETKIFKVVVIIVGIVVTCMVFYSSLVPVPTYHTPHGAAAMHKELF